MKNMNRQEDMNIDIAKRLSRTETNIEYLHGEVDGLNEKMEQLLERVGKIQVALYAIAASILLGADLTNLLRIFKAIGIA